ncbi:MAG: thiamine pyrophosphate-binding protein [Chloroflexi bacterium]|nr:MAG: thiamine pyrophosphate-binding protein [Chloroflexota bacterium]
MKVSEAVGRLLVERGVRQVFGLIGSGNFDVTLAMVEAGASFAPSRHEGGAITMADAFGRASGEVAACSVHQGPGLTNTMTGLTEAAKSRTPLLLLAAETAASATRSNFRIDQEALVTSVGAVVARLREPATALADAALALQRARDERRPVVLMLPLDIQAAECSSGAPPPARPAAPPPEPQADAVHEVADLLVGAQRPVIIGGRGALGPGAREAIEELADATGALLATSAVAAGLFAGNPWSVGITGGFATPLAAELMVEADLVLSFGATLNMWSTRHGHLIGPGAHVVQVDIDRDAIGSHLRAQAGIVGDAAATARALAGELHRRGHHREGWRSAGLAERIARAGWSQQPFEEAASPDHIDPRALSIALDELLPAGRTLVVDSGHFMGWAPMYMAIAPDRGFIFTQSFQSIGLGLATAIGTAVARPQRLTVAALGDGGLLMSLPELETVARLSLNLLIVVYNDAAYGAEVHHFATLGKPTDIVRFPDTDFAAIAQACGLEGLTVRSPDDLAPAAEWLAGNRGKALLIDAKVIPTVVAEWLEEAFKGH